MAEAEPLAGGVEMLSSEPESATEQLNENLQQPGTGSEEQDTSRQARGQPGPKPRRGASEEFTALRTFWSQAPSTALAPLATCGSGGQVTVTTLFQLSVCFLLLQ